MFFLYLWDYSIIILAGFMCILPVLNYSRIKTSVLIPVMTVILAVTTVILSVLRALLDTSADFPLLIAIIPLTLLYFFIFDIRKTKLLYIYLSVITCLSFGGTSTYFLEAQLDMHYDIYIAFTVKWLISLMFFAAEIIFLKKVQWIIDNDNVNEIWRFIWIIPVIIFIINILFIPQDSANVRVGRIFLLYVIVEIVLVIFYVIFNAMLTNIARAITRESEARQNAQLLKLQAAQYSNLKSYLDSTSRMRHDFRYMVKAAGTLAAEGETEKLLDLLEEYGNDIDNVSAPEKYCENKILNAVVAYYAEKAKNNDINFETRLNVPENISISESDVCSITGNILDNAVFAAGEKGTSEHKILFIADTKDNGDLYIIVTNSCNGNIKENKKVFTTTKPGGHGIGLQSVDAIVKKYNGYCNFRYKENTFYSEIMLKHRSDDPA